MILGLFGIPGVGKTTTGTKFARDELKRIKRGKSNYKGVATSFYCKGCLKVTWEDLAKYKFYDILVIFDELGLDADNRNFKDFSKGHRDFFTLHRHLGIDFIYLTQDYSKVDAKIRALTQELWYMSRSVVPFLRNFTVCKRIFRTITINENTGDLNMGYRFCNLVERFFVSNFKIIFRPLYYKYFDSYDECQLSDRPILEMVPWTNEKELDSFLARNFNKLKIRFNLLLRKGFRKIKKVKKTWNNGA